MSRTNLRPHIYDRNEGGGPWWKTAQWSWMPTIRGHYFGTLFKGWWKLGDGRINRDLCLEIALGGEDNMLQLGIAIPLLFRWHIGVRVPRWATKGWVYERREWMLRFGYVGRLAELMIAYDESASSMRGYYARLRESGKIVNSTRASLWPGWHLTIRAPRLLDWLFGRMQYEATEDTPVDVLVPMPEGNYPAEVRRIEAIWKRPRLPWPDRKRVDFAIKMLIGIPCPGKGENSYDIEDDAIFGTGGSSVFDAIANATRAALRNRERYGSPNWTPEDGWPIAHQIQQRLEQLMADAHAKSNDPTFSEIDQGVFGGEESGLSYALNLLSNGIFAVIPAVDREGS